MYISCDKRFFIFDFFCKLRFFGKLTRVKNNFSFLRIFLYKEKPSNFCKYEKTNSQ